MSELIPFIDLGKPGANYRPTYAVIDHEGRMRFPQCARNQMPDFLEPIGGKDSRGLPRMGITAAYRDPPNGPAWVLAEDAYRAEGKLEIYEKVVAPYIDRAFPRGGGKGPKGLGGFGFANGKDGSGRGTLWEYLPQVAKDRQLGTAPEQQHWKPDPSLLSKPEKPKARASK